MYLFIKDVNFLSSKYFVKKWKNNIRYFKLNKIGIIDSSAFRNLLNRILFLKGKSLQEIIEIDMEMEYSKVTLYFCQLLKAVGFLHEKLIVHSYINTA